MLRTAQRSATGRVARQLVLPASSPATSSKLGGARRISSNQNGSSIVNALADNVTRRQRPSIDARGLASVASLGESLVSQVTTLPNGLRVATESTPGHFQALGAYVDAGSRFEWAGTSGVSHLLDRMAFKTTSDYTSSDMSNIIDSMGSQVVCSSSRETIMYQATVFPHDASKALSLIASSILRPLVLPEELEAQKEAAAYEIREIWQKPEMIVPELFHSAAYRDNTLGMPLLCPEDRLAEITPDTIRGFMRDWFRPERIVLAGVGMPHEELVGLAEQYFGSMRSASSPTISTSTNASAPLHPSSHSTPPHLSKSFATLQRGNAAGVAPTPEQLASAKAVYTGGQLMIEKPDEPFTHVYVGFEGLGIHDPDIYALATLQMLLGGGGSFSAGGPGKGMYSRLYTQVLNRYWNVDYCAGFHHCYADSGLFGIAASVNPDFNTSIGNVIAHSLDTLTRPMKGGVTEVELARARNQLKSSLMMALESRSVEVEDLGRQTQIHGKKVPVEEMCAKIDAVTLADIHRTASRVLRPAENPSKPLNDGLGSGQPTIVCYGNLTGLHDLPDVINSWGLGKGGVAPRSFVS